MSEPPDNDTWVVIWRGGRRQRWQVQPHVHSERNAERVATALMSRFRGEACICPVAIPPMNAEDASD